MTLPSTPPTVTVPLHPTTEQTRRLVSMGERLNTLRTWCYAQAVGHVPPGTTLAELAYGAPATSNAVNDEVAALLLLSSFTDLPADVLVETITETWRAIHEERQQTGRLRPYSHVWERYDITIAGPAWVSVWTPELVTLAGVDGAVEAELTHHTVPPAVVQGWRNERLAWCAWAQGTTIRLRGAQLARYRQDLRRHREAGETLPSVAELQQAWAAVPGVGGRAQLPGVARVEQLESGWWLTL
ncbi:hypothetical protein HNQ07_004508 [Deinococcus metalli]|uniref:Uncharacterized protein n=1 Tax=Deinococcus metalli TaxID=1141878 RepID=A0A7W8KKM8_9DEIO|nr:hypothetical protein [Deinococcus metalli]MBB5378998.1 hypothetical protein [Deinococcus metalli]GHF63479.1 hypothetical protein GCM10017781_44280 [Deinococcus metalli]